MRCKIEKKGVHNDHFTWINTLSPLFSSPPLLFCSPSSLSIFATFPLFSPLFTVSIQTVPPVSLPWLRTLR